MKKHLLFFGAILTISFLFGTNAVFGQSNPTISSIEPSSAKVGETVTIYGDGFEQGVYVDLMDEGTWIVSSYTNSQVEFVVPAGWGIGDHRLRISHKASDDHSNIVDFTVESNSPPPVIPPTISSISPSTARVGDTVTIYGSNFDQGAYIEVIGNGTWVLSSYTNSQAKFVVPSGWSVGNHRLRISHKASDNNSNIVDFTVTSAFQADPGPTISSVNPISAGTGVTVTIYGSGFGSDSYIESVGENISIKPSSYSNTQLKFVVPSGMTIGTHRLRVSKRLGTQGTNTGVFTVLAPTPTRPSTPYQPPTDNSNIEESENRVEQELDSFDEAQRRLDDDLKVRIKTLSGTMVLRLEAAFKRIDGLIARIESRLDKLDSAGIGTSSARRELEEARILTREGRTELDQVPNEIDQMLESNDLRSAFGEVERLVNELINDHVKASHGALVETVGIMKESI